MVTELPSLSVILPTRNRADKLKIQAYRLVEELLPTDELCILDDASTDSTPTVISNLTERGNVVAFRSEKPTGVCGAYDWLAARASKEWILGAADDDLVQEGAITEWRQAVKSWPDCRIVFGRVFPSCPLPWDIKPRLFSREEMVEVWKLHMLHDTHGAGVFIRRDVWGSGYVAGEHMADWWHAWKIAARHGCGYIPTIVSVLGPAGYSAQHADDKVYNRCIAEIRKNARSPECDDIADQIKHYNRITNFLSARPEMVSFHKGK